MSTTMNIIKITSNDTSDPPNEYCKFGTKDLVEEDEDITAEVEALMDDLEDLLWRSRKLKGKDSTEHEEVLSW
ncbi:hypothetical protein FQN53_000506 [Emmonsiellopsis sp. PD_33]|nr:hypothetical protein FQN53_000506 [Emmonsiellopsis sp. PD_33]